MRKRKGCGLHFVPDQLLCLLPKKKFSFSQGREKRTIWKESLHDPEKNCIRGSITRSCLSGILSQSLGSLSGGTARALVRDSHRLSSRSLGVCCQVCIHILASTRLSCTPLGLAGFQAGLGFLGVSKTCGWAVFSTRSTGRFWAST